jgi:Flp pilus assembly protein TadD
MHNLVNYLKMGMAAQQESRIEDAAAIYKLLIENYKNHPDAYNLLGVIEKDKLNYARAMELVNHAIMLNPMEAGYYLNLGNIYRENYKYKKALEIYEYSTLLKKDFKEAHENIINILIDENNYEKAIEKCKNAISNLKKQDQAKIYQLMGKSFTGLDLKEEAIKHFNKSIEINPNSFDALFEKGLVYLSQNKFTEGWNLYSYRWKTTGFNSKQISSKIPKYTKEESGGSVLIWSEQGIGDQILHLTMLSSLLKINNTVTLAIDRRLIPIFKRSYPSINTIPLETIIEKNELDYQNQISIGDLGRQFRNDVIDFESINFENKYLFADRNKTTELKEKILNNSNKKKIICGISWKSSNKDIGLLKSLRLRELQSLFAMTEVVFINLQYGDVKNEIEEIKNEFGVEIKTMEDIDNFNDLDGYLSLVEACDLVVTTSNTCAHFAGALSKETYLMLPFGRGAIWYWLNHKDGVNLWYPSVKIVRQNNNKSWSYAIDQIILKIKEFL